MKTLSEDLKRWRDNRPDGVQMDSFIRRALILEKESKEECEFERFCCLLQKEYDCNPGCPGWKVKGE